MKTRARARAQDFPLVPAEECHARQGLPNFFVKAKKRNTDLRIGYLGGSITAQAGWRPKTLAHFQKTYPQARFTEINAAIGGTGSDLGVFRLQQDVLDQRPDLLFVEFAVNDGGAPPEQILRCMEGIVRQTWRELPSCDLCFVYTITESLAPPLLEGKFPRAASVMEKLADHYGIPSIHLAMEVAQLAKAGKLIWSAPLPKERSEGQPLVFAADGVHPYPETGHELYLQAIVRSLTPLAAASGTKGRRHTLRSPLVPTNYERAQLLPVGAGILSPGFVRLDPKTDPLAKSFAARLGGLWRTNTPGATLTFRFKGTYAALYDLLGPDGGQVWVTLDNQAPRLVPRFDSFSTYPRLATLVIGADLPDTVHTAKVELHPQQPDKVKILAQRNEKIDNPARYNDIAFYPGSLLLVGELVR